MVSTKDKSRKQGQGKRSLGHAKSVADEDIALGEELLRVSRKEQADFVGGWSKFMKQLGIRGKPIGAKKLRAMMLKRGFNPETNEFSRGIIAMREE